MKKIFFLILFFILINEKVNCQNDIVITNIRLLQDNYTSKDTIKIIVDITTLVASRYLGHTLNIDFNQVNINTCFLLSGGTSVNRYIDTIKLGKLSENDYNLTVYGHSSSTYPECTPKDTVQKSIQFSISTGVKEIKKYPNVKIYPNPVNQEMNVEIRDINKEVEINIMDIRGQLMLRKIIPKFSNLSTKVLINLNDFREGMYFIYIKSFNFLKLKSF